jgi:multimeric flavodoxin WrbA
LAIVGVSGSPIQGGNTDRVVRSLLEQSGHDHTFVNLSTLDFVSCRGCAHLCARSNICPLEDDLRPYFEAILEADALVLASPVHAGTITAWMFSFLSRIWCFHHLKNLLEDKPLLLVVTALSPQSWGHNMHHLGTLFHATEIPPCYKCGVGNACKVGGLWAMVGQDAEKLRNFEVTPDKFKRWEDCPQTVERVAHYAEMLGKISGA